MSYKNEQPTHEQNIGKGVLFGILAAFSFSMMSLFGKIIDNNTSTNVILFARFSISLILLMPWVFINPKEALSIKRPLTILSRSLCTFLAFSCFFYALQFIPLSNALLLNNTFPLFVPIIVWLIGRHRTPQKVWFGIILGFIGVGFVLKPESGFFQIASIIGLASGILAATGMVIIRGLTKTTPIIQILFYNFLICSILTAILLSFGWKSFSIDTFYLLLGVGFFGAAYQFFSTLSYAKSPVRITSCLMFLCILFGILADWFFWHRVLDIFTLIGMLFVIMGGIVTVYFGQKEIMK